MLGSKFFGGPVRYVLAASGHIAGVVNPPEKHKYHYWTGRRPRSANLEGWIAKATQHPGSWWPDWFAWLTKRRRRRCPRASPAPASSKPSRTRREATSRCRPQ